MEEEPSQRNFVNPIFPLSNRSSTLAVSDLCTEVEEKVVEAAEIRVECGGGGGEESMRGIPTRDESTEGPQNPRRSQNAA
ncbi:hypothetical protein ACFX1X_015077 [Malus domestica]